MNQHEQTIRYINQKIVDTKTRIAVLKAQIKRTTIAETKAKLELELEDQQIALAYLEEQRHQEYEADFQNSCFDVKVTCDTITQIAEEWSKKDNQEQPEPPKHGSNSEIVKR